MILVNGEVIDENGEVVVETLPKANEPHDHRLLDAEHPTPDSGVSRCVICGCVIRYEDGGDAWYLPATVKDTHADAD